MAGKGGFTKRNREHQKSSMMRTESDRQSLFYNTYPNKNSDWFKGNDINPKGNFDQLRQVVGIGYAQTKKMDVCALFNWNDDVINMLKKINVVGASD